MSTNFVLYNNFRGLISLDSHAPSWLHEPIVPLSDDSYKSWW